MGTRYIKGRRREYYIRDLLREQGYIVVRSAGSRTPIDLVAINPQTHEILLVQVKAPTRQPTRAELEFLRRLKGTYTVRPMVTKLVNGVTRLVEVD